MTRFQTAFYCLVFCFFFPVLLLEWMLRETEAKTGITEKITTGLIRRQMAVFIRAGCTIRGSGTGLMSAVGFRPAASVT